MNTKLDKLLPLAFDALDAMLGSESFRKKNGRIPKQYNGYIASFGASVVQSGMMAALVFNYNKDANSETDKRPLMDALSHVVFEMRGETKANVKEQTLDTYFRASEDKNQLKKQILDAATAIKLVLRTYPFEVNDHE